MYDRPWRRGSNGIKRPPMAAIFLFALYLRPLNPDPVPSMDASHILSIIFGLGAAVLIAVGRHHIRRSKRQPPKSAWRRRRRSLGWLLVVTGTLTMIIAAV